MFTSIAPNAVFLPNSSLVVRPVAREVHARFVHRMGAKGQVSFLQHPSWADVKEAWWPEFLGWFDGAVQVGAAMVLCRRAPGTRRFFAYLPEGPVLDWSRKDIGEQLGLLTENLWKLGAFAVRMGPPLEYKRWSAATLKAATGPGRRLTHVGPDATNPVAVSVAEQLRSSGWRRCDDGPAGGDAQPRYLFTVPMAGLNDDDLWSGLNQAWRRSVRRAEHEHVVVTVGAEQDLPTLFRLLQETERRNDFRLGRSLGYFQRQYRALNDEMPGRMKLYLAWHHDEVLAAHTMVTLGARSWYLTGASATAGRDVRPSHALQWQMIRAARAGRADVYDMRGVPTSLDPDDPAFGLLRWKLGTGGGVVETLGEWGVTLPGWTNRMLQWAMRRRAAHR
ncbi:lipid II:glycine glycyltransferase FemX [Phytoactinopolyspora endophytica]|uniref:lipid II:glycine glycyltransferase FemX n=1 Tax=Phytoactinopolyspora endophytica TaxID=1642495 RepID=UPI00101C9AA9|nr:peptidoglycan bridge formation glycyltransferase FemA/FemB family protein [Phytoactinopolyspora endophytica]